jgi:hypothetical protein
MAIAFKLGAILTTDILVSLVNNGFTESKSFTKAGILYAENKEIIATGAFNTNILQITCKSANCTGSINSLEQLLATMG